MGKRALLCASPMNTTPLMVVSTKEMGHRLKIARKAAGYRSAEVAANAKGCPVPEGTLGNWESGRVRGLISEVAQLAEFYQCSLDYIVGLSEDLTGLPLGRAVVSMDLVRRIRSATSWDEIRDDVMKSLDNEGLIDLGHVISRDTELLTARDWAKLNAECQSKIEKLRAAADEGA